MTSDYFRSSYERTELELGEAIDSQDKKKITAAKKELRHQNSILWDDAIKENISRDVNNTLESTEKHTTIDVLFSRFIDTGSKPIISSFPEELRGVYLAQKLIDHGLIEDLENQIELFLPSSHLPIANILINDLYVGLQGEEELLKFTGLDVNILCTLSNHGMDFNILVKYVAQSEGDCNLLIAGIFQKFNEESQYDLMGVFLKNIADFRELNWETFQIFIKQDRTFEGYEIVTGVKSFQSVLHKDIAMELLTHPDIRDCVFQYKDLFDGFRYDSEAIYSLLRKDQMYGYNFEYNFIISNLDKMEDGIDPTIAYKLIEDFRFKNEYLMDSDFLEGMLGVLYKFTGLSKVDFIITLWDTLFFLNSIDDKKDAIKRINTFMWQDKFTKEDRKKVRDQFYYYM